MIADTVRRAAEFCRCSRVRFDDGQLPTSFSNISVLMLFGDLKSKFIQSSLILRRYIESRPSRYFIVCSWKGDEHLYPYVDEFWSMDNLEGLSAMARQADGFYNNSDVALELERNLRRFFEEVITADTFAEYYDKGLTKKFFDKFGQIAYYLPMIPSLPSEISKYYLRINGPKVFIHPVKNINLHRLTDKIQIVPKKFWENLLEQLLANGFAPVIYQNYSTYDLTNQFDSSTCVPIVDRPMSEVLGAMRASDCVLDVFSGLSRLAIMARCPYVAVDERAKYNHFKEFEIDDLCGKGIPREIVYTFGTMLSEQPKNICSHLIKKVEAIVKDTKRDELPSTSEFLDLLSYDSVRKIKSKKLGTRLFKVERI